MYPKKSEEYNMIFNIKVLWEKHKMLSIITILNSSNTMYTMSS